MVPGTGKKCAYLATLDDSIQLRCEDPLHKGLAIGDDESVARRALRVRPEGRVVYDLDDGS